MFDSAVCLTTYYIRKCHDNNQNRSLKKLEWRFWKQYNTKCVYILHAL